MSLRIEKRVGYAMEFPSIEAEEVVNLEVVHSQKLKKKDYCDWVAKQGVYTDGELSYELTGVRGTSARTVWDVMKLVDNEYDENPDRSSIFIITPWVQYDEWVRRDHMIDWLETGEAADNYQVKWVDHNLFPYFGKMHAVTGEPVEGVAGDFITTIRAVADYRNTPDEEELPDGVTDKLAQWGVRTYGELRTSFVPDVPDDVRWLAQWSGVFKNSADVIKLRPALLTYWS